MSRLPPGCSTQDLPGFRPSDIRRDKIERYAEKNSIPFDEAEERIETMERDAAAEQAEEICERRY